MRVAIEIRSQSDVGNQRIYLSYPSEWVTPMANLLEPVNQLPKTQQLKAELPMIAAQRHQTYRVSRVEGDSSDSHRLKALGFCEGREVQILRTGRSWVVRVLGSRVGLSSQLAAIVQLIPAA